MTILNKEGNISNYFNNAYSSVNERDNITWKIQLFNGMNIIEYYTIKIKIVNLTGPSPDIISLTPTNTTAIYQIHKFLRPSEEVEIPFSWRVNEFKVRVIKSLTINNNTIPINLKIDKDYKVKIIFELWKYNKDTNEFEFKFLIGEKYTCIWNQINFDINP